MFVFCFSSSFSLETLNTLFNNQMYIYQVDSSMQSKTGAGSVDIIYYPCHDPPVECQQRLAIRFFL